MSRAPLRVRATISWSAVATTAIQNTQVTTVASVCSRLRGLTGLRVGADIEGLAYRLSLLSRIVTNDNRYVNNTELGQVTLWPLLVLTRRRSRCRPGQLGQWKNDVFAAARFLRPPPWPAAAAPGRPVPRAARRGGGRARRKTAPGQAVVPALLRPAERGRAHDDRHPAVGPGRPGGRAAAPAADRGTLRELRQRRHQQVLVARSRRHPGRERGHALRRPHHGLRVQPGGLRDGLPVLRHRPGWPAAQPVHGGDYRAGPGGGGDGQGRSPWAARPAVQRRVHGHGRAAGELPADGGRGTPDLRPGPSWVRHLAAFGHRVHGWARSCNTPAGG